MTRPRKRKMEALIGGDNCKAHESCSSAKQSKSTSPRSVHSVCVQSGAASGDSTSDICHQHVTILKNLDDDDERSVVHIQSCDLGDVWTQQYPIPLSSYPNHDIETGNSYYDAIIPELQTIGYKPLQVIAKGRSGTVIIAQDLSPEKVGTESEYRPVALKLNSGKKRKYHRLNRADVTDEMLIHQTLVHPNIVRMLCPLSYQGRGGLVLEFCESGNLEMLLKSQDARFLTEPICQKYFIQILNALEYIHLSGYAHRDVCPSNILVSNENTLKLADFGHAVKFTAGDKLCEDSSGTLGYQSPEIVCKTPYNPKMADMWSLGAVLYMMAVGRLPFGRLKTEEMAKNIKRMSCPDAHVMILSSEIKELMDGLLAYIPESRYSLNRCRNSDWTTMRQKRVQIGNFYLVRQPQKIFEGEREKDIKRNFEI
ncbi:aurora kinase B-like [Gigantopelta aegis]|uniref:aurora kinase B-like n=1 Tax=Gigantopelta aegis TaxID=1735272 RepID=UPI001B88D53B|nr:aurora kinase B-like [Gigantopelta aegis]